MAIDVGRLQAIDELAERLYRMRRRVEFVKAWCSEIDREWDELDRRLRALGVDDDEDDEDVA